MKDLLVRPTYELLPHGSGDSAERATATVPRGAGPAAILEPANLKPVPALAPLKHLLPLARGDGVRTAAGTFGEHMVGTETRI